MKSKFIEAQCKRARLAADILNGNPTRDEKEKYYPFLVGFIDGVSKAVIPKFEIGDRVEYGSTNYITQDHSRIREGKVVSMEMRYVIEMDNGKIIGSTYGVGESQLRKSTDKIKVSKAQVAAKLGIPVERLEIV